MAFVTNGNWFSNVGLAPILHSLSAARLPTLVFLTTGLRRQGRSRVLEGIRLARTWGVRLLMLKLLGTVVATVMGVLTRRPLTVSQTCREVGITVAHTRNLNVGEGFAALEAFQPAVLVSFSCPYRLTASVLGQPSIGALNAHSSLLPEYAGVSTYVHVLAEGRCSTGFTVHEMVEKFDAGRILAQSESVIPERTSVFALFHELCVRGGALLEAVVWDALRSGTLSGKPQELSKRSYRGEPTSKQVRQLKARGHAVIRLNDFVALLRPPRPTDGS